MAHNVKVERVSTHSTAVFMIKARSIDVALGGDCRSPRRSRGSSKRVAIVFVAINRRRVGPVSHTINNTFGDSMAGEWLLCTPCSLAYSESCIAAGGNPKVPLDGYTGVFDAGERVRHWISAIARSRCFAISQLVGPWLHSSELVSWCGAA
jgi:hypothetical protein